MDGHIALEKVSVTLGTVPQCWPHSLHLHVDWDGVDRLTFANGGEL